MQTNDKQEKETQDLQSERGDLDIHETDSIDATGLHIDHENRDDGCISRKKSKANLKNPFEALNEAMGELDIMNQNNRMEEQQLLNQESLPQTHKQKPQVFFKSNDSAQVGGISLKNIGVNPKNNHENQMTISKTLDSVGWLRDLHRRDEEFRNRMNSIHRKAHERTRQQEEQQQLTERMNQEEERKKIAARHAEGRLKSHAQNRREKTREGSVKI